jgi:hypothetical protein
VPLADYDFVLTDPPYSASDAERYGTAMANRNKLVRTLSEGLHPWRLRCVARPGLSDVHQGATEARGGDRDRGVDQPWFRVLTVFRRHEGEATA